MNNEVQQASDRSATTYDEDIPVFEGFVRPTKNYFPMPNIWIEVCAQITNLAELKVIQYVLRHTWGYHEYGKAKAITVDEFMYGRKRQDGKTRMDSGTGLKSDRSVKDGLKAALKHGYLVCEVDDTDRARIRKSYALKMLPHPEGYDQPTESEGVDTTPHVSEKRQRDTTPLASKKYPSGSQNLPADQVEPPSRSEKDTWEKHQKKNTDGRQEEASPTSASVCSLTTKLSLGTSEPCEEGEQTNKQSMLSSPTAPIALRSECSMQPTSSPLSAAQVQQVAEILHVPVTGALTRLVTEYTSLGSLALLGEADAAREWIDDETRNRGHKAMTVAFFRRWLKREQEAIEQRRAAPLSPIGNRSQNGVHLSMRGNPVPDAPRLPSLMHLDEEDRLFGVKS